MCTCLTLYYVSYMPIEYEATLKCEILSPNQLLFAWHFGSDSTLSPPNSDDVITVVSCYIISHYME